MMARCQGDPFDKYFDFMEDHERLERLNRLKDHFERLESSLVSNEEHHVELLERVWDSLPEDILGNIWMRLPVATLGRLRCVSSRWKALLSAPFPACQDSRLTCTIMTDGLCSRDRFFCYGENKWFRMPSQPWWGMQAAWRLVASNGGLLCYERRQLASLRLLVCNPMTSSYQILIPPRPEELEVMTFSVDLKAKTFEMVLMCDEVTLAYDSQTQEWKVSEGIWEAFPDLPEPDNDHRGFVWKNVLYRRIGDESTFTYLAFDMASGTWSVKDLELPCRRKDCYHLQNWKDQVVLVQLYPTKRDPVRVWWLRDNPRNASKWEWEKVPVEVPDSMEPVVNELLDCLSYGHEYLCFTTGWTHHWVKYTFKTKTWQLMPRRGRSNQKFDPLYCEFRWFNFEPQLCMDLPANHVDGNDSDIPADFGVRPRERDNPEDSDTSEDSDASEDSNASEDSYGAHYSDDSDGPPDHLIGEIRL